MGYSLKAFEPVKNVTPSASLDIDVFTVPASHTYLLKHLSIRMVADSSTATTGKIQVSATDGTTFTDVTSAFSTGATTGNTKAVDFCIPYTNVADSAVASTTTSTRATTSALHNLILAAGQKLRVVKTGATGGGNAPELSILCSVVDFV